MSKMASQEISESEIQFSAMVPQITNLKSDWAIYPSTLEVSVQNIL